MTGITGVAHATVAICVALLLGGCVAREESAATSPTAIPTAHLTSGEPSVSASPIVRPLRDQTGLAILDPGTYVLDLFPVDLAFDIPDGDPPGWHVGESNADSAIVLWFTPPEITYEFAFSTADNVYVDPCNAAAGEFEPPIGPSVDDLVAALLNMPEFEVTAPVDVTVGAFRGKEIELTALDSGGDCPEVIAFRAGDEDYDLEPGRSLRLQILDVDGVRIVIRIVEPAERDAAVAAELQQILDSIRIERLP
jgi:hypothetical protein